MDEKYLQTTGELIDFIAGSPSRFHVVENLKAMFLNAGFAELSESRPFCVENGGKYFVTRNGSSVMAFTIPETGIEGYSIVAAHTDAPTFRIKNNPEMEKGVYTTLNVEAYGGMLMAPWFDRPLTVAGRAFVKEDGGIKEKTVFIDRDLCQIVNLCIHQNREANKGYEYNVQRDLCPIIGLGNNAGAVKQLVADELKIEAENLLECDLFLVNRQKGSIWGLDNAFFSCPRIDDLMCAYSAAKALLSAKRSNFVQLCALFDNEEVGSLTKQGACSDFMLQTINRINASLKLGYEQQCIIQSRSFMLSADNGHAMHPNYPEKCDPTNRPAPNRGVLIKFAANQKYTTDAASAAQFKDLLDRNGIPYQDFFNNSAVSGGSTLGNLSTGVYSIPTVDIGAAQLAMHSPYETAGTKDTAILTDAMRLFFER